MRCICISDTHNQHRVLTIPDGDVLVHAGDFTMRGQDIEMVEFNAWLGTLPHKYKVIVPGNHDLCFEDNAERAKALLSNATHILLHEEVVIEGKRFFGSPFTPFFRDWAFNYKADRAETLWGQIPEGLDMLITHGPPHGILDQLKAPSSPVGDHVGCPVLAAHVVRAQPKVHVFGHIHEGAGVVAAKPTSYINAASLSNKYRPEYQAGRIVHI